MKRFVLLFLVFMTAVCFNVCAAADLSMGSVDKPVLFPGGSLNVSELSELMDSDEDCEEICTIKSDPLPVTIEKPQSMINLAPIEPDVEFVTTDLDGSIVRSDDLLAHQKVTMLNIWSTSCNACLVELPRLNGMSEDLRGKGGQIVGLVYDADESDLVEEARDIVDDLQVRFLNLLPNEDIRDIFNVQSFPITYFISDRGEIIGDPVMGASVERYQLLMDEYLATAE